MSQRRSFTRSSPTNRSRRRRRSRVIPSQPVAFEKGVLMHNPEKIKKVSVIVSRGSLDGVYPGLIMANGARMEGIEANLFFTFFGLDAIHRSRHQHVKAS